MAGVSLKLIERARCGRGESKADIESQMWQG